MSIDLTTHYGGLTLRSPLIVGACPLTAQDQSRIAMESAGAGAIVLPSLFEEQAIRWNQQRGATLNELEEDLLRRSESANRVEAVYEDGDTYLSIVNRASSQMHIPVLASLNGHMVTDWVDFAGQLEQAGAAGIELNIHHPPPQNYSGPREIEDAIVELVRKINDVIRIPLFLKLGNDYTSLPHLTCRLLSGASGLVLHGRAPAVDILLDDMTLKSSWDLTSSGSIVQSLGSIMQVHSYCPAMSLAACGGIGSSCDLIKALLAGADVAMVTSAIYREGTDVIRSLLDGLVNFMERHHLSSLRELELQRPLQFNTDDERTAYVNALTARLENNASLSGQGILRGDRWGHPTTEND